MKIYSPDMAGPQPAFLPTSQAEMEMLGWDELDILLIQGDAYIDHPAQGPALLGRWLVAHGFRVGLVSQPRWREKAEAAADLTVMGRPRLFAALSAGSMDSMLAHYTAFRKLRHDDALTPGGRHGARPNRATLVYAGLARAAFPGLPVYIGGLEASLRRLSHYDFWQDKLRRSALLESKADLLIYGPGERPLLALAQRLRQEPGLIAPGDIPGTALALKADQRSEFDFLDLPAHEEIEADPRLLMAATLAAEQAVHQGGPALRQLSAARAVLVNPPPAPLTTAELDFLYGLPFTRRAHPSYKARVPALEVLGASLTTHRGCGGGCSFCSLALHQGRAVASRSAESIAAEAARLGAAKPVALSDVGAATANLWGAECRSDRKKCLRRSCLWPAVCPHLEADQKKWLGLLKKVASLPEVKQVRVASGVRYDLALADKASLADFLKNFVGGQLKVAPEHLEPDVLKLMRKPGPEVFKAFLKLFAEVSAPQKVSAEASGGLNRKGGKTAAGRSAVRDRFVVPYLISAFPGSETAGMKRLADWFESRHWRPRQVQAFIPTPGTVATAMYFGGIDEKGRPLRVARTDRDRLKQHAFLAPDNR